MDQSGARQIGQIDALRGLAACLVAFVFHAFYILQVNRTGPLDGIPGFTWLHAYGWTLVDLFFVISGFIFSHVYLNNCELKTGVTFKSFMIARVARLYPLHLLTFFMIIPAIAIGVGLPHDYDNFDVKHAVLNLLMLQVSGLNDGLSFNIPAWSISVEVFCYLAFICCALVGGRVLKWFAPCAVIVGLLVTADPHAHIDHIARGFVGFFVGHIVWRNRNRRIPAVVLMIAAAAPFYFKPPMMSYGAYLSLTAWPAILLLSMRCNFLNAKPFRWLGERSYSIYLIHAPIYYWISAVFFDGGPAPRADWIQLNLMCVIIILVASDISYRWFENPLRLKIKEKFIGHQRSSVGSEAMAAR